MRNACSLPWLVPGPAMLSLRLLMHLSSAMASKSEHQRVAVFQPEFLDDLSYWVETERRTAKRLLELELKRL